MLSSFMKETTFHKYHLLLINNNDNMPTGFEDMYTFGHLN